MTTDILELDEQRIEKHDELVGGYWIHVKGGLYEVKAVTVCSETKQLLVTYQEVDEQGWKVKGVPPWTRPLSMWREPVAVGLGGAPFDVQGEVTCPRFRRPDEPHW